MPITYGDFPLLSVRESELRHVARAAKRLARRIGLQVAGPNELYWPSGAGRFGGMIGLIEEARAAALRDFWEPWRSGGSSAPSDLPALAFHDAPTMRASLAAIEPLDSASGGLHLVALVDGRRSLQEASFAPVADPALVDWPSAIAAAAGSVGPEVVLSQSIADRLQPEIDDAGVLTMSRGEWLDAAAWSVGGEWRLRPSGELDLQSPADAESTESANRAGTLPIVDGRFDQQPLRPVGGVDLRVRPAHGAVPWPREEVLFSADSLPALDAATRWSPRTTALWERTPVDASQENGGELQDLAEALLADAESWTGRTYAMRFAGFVPWQPGARDRTVRWIDRGRDCFTIVETLTPEDLPSRLVHRSSVVPREASLAEAVTETSGSAGGTVVCELLARPGRPARRVDARYPLHPGGLSVSAGQSVWLDYDRSAGEWILVPWTTA